MFENSRRAILEVLNQAIAEGFTKKAACLVARGDQVLELHAGDSSPELEYDLASLTKVLCTTYLTAKIPPGPPFSRAGILVEEPWPNWPGVSVEHVLNHTSGLPAWVQISSIEDVLAVKPVEKPGVKTVYSDIGFMALGAFLEERLGAPLDDLFLNHAVHFYGQEPVDDANCRALGGVAGHAGLFGTVRSVFHEAKFLLGAIKNPVSEFEHRLQEFAQYPGERGLGFDKATLGGSTGEALSDQAVGHLGFTGTSLWIDPVGNAIYVLLMRRLDNGSKAKDLLEIRRKFHQAASR